MLVIDFSFWRITSSVPYSIPVENFQLYQLSIVHYGNVKLLILTKLADYGLWSASIQKLGQLIIWASSSLVVYPFKRFEQIVSKVLLRFRDMLTEASFLDIFAKNIKWQPTLNDQIISLTSPLSFNMQSRKTTAILKQMLQLPFVHLTLMFSAT